jgi:TPR repeat protein
MDFTNRIELAQLNLEKGRNDAAFEIFFDLAKNDLNDDANYALTKMCFDGKLSTDQIQNFYEFQNSNSSLGNGYAHFNVGLMHERGMGEIKQDFKTAVIYYEKAIKEEVHDAYCNLGNIYVLGTAIEFGVPRDVERGAELLAKGANEGSRQSAYTLGSLYGKGEFITQDLSKSFYFLTLAALAKHDQAHRVLHIFQNTHKGDYSKEFDAAEQQFWKIENMRRLYRCI